MKLCQDEKNHLEGFGLNGNFNWIFKAEDTKKWTGVQADSIFFGHETAKAILVYFEVGGNSTNNPVYEEWIPKSCIKIVKNGYFFDFQIATWIIMSNGWFQSKLSRAFV